MALRPVSFRYKNEAAGSLHHGLVAQEVERTIRDTGMDQTFAGFVKTPDTEKKGDYVYGLCYMEFIPMLIQMVQNQQMEIDALRARAD
jgi:hypothetical protein